MQHDFREIFRKYKIDFQENCTVTATEGSHLRANPKKCMRNNWKQIGTYEIGKSSYKQQKMKIKSFRI